MLEFLKSIGITKLEFLFIIKHLFVVSLIVIFIEILKGIFPKLHKNVWKITVLIFGVIAASIIFGVDNLYKLFNVWLFISLSIVYASLASMLYQTGKLSIKGIKDFIKNFSIKKK